MPDGINIARAE